MNAVAWIKAGGRKFNQWMAYGQQGAVGIFWGSQGPSSPAVPPRIKRMLLGVGL